MFAALLGELFRDRPDATLSAEELREFYRDVYRTIDEWLLEDAVPREVSLDDPSPSGPPWSEVLVAPESDYPERVQLRLYVRELLRDLPPDQLELVHRLYWQEQDRVAAADQMGLTPGAFDALHGKALGRLRFLWSHA